MRSRLSVHHTQARPYGHPAKMLQVGAYARRIVAFTMVLLHANWYPKRFISLPGNRKNTEVPRSSSFLYKVKRGFASPMRWKGDGLALTVGTIGPRLGMIIAL